MKLFMNKNEKYEEPEVHMFFHKQTKEVEQVEKFVRSLSITVPVQYEDEIYKLYPLVWIPELLWIWRGSSGKFRCCGETAIEG